jgi:hypothetical protein
MVRSLGRLVKCVALVGATLLGAQNAASAQATASATQLHYTTAIKQFYGAQYPITGRLDLELFPAGNIRGYYHTSFYKLYIPVVGGRDGSYMWLDIGPSSIDLGLDAGPNGKLHLVGTVNSDDTFTGQVYPETAAVLSGMAMQNQFANPQPTSNDQYIFTATPTTEPAPTPPTP